MKLITKKYYIIEWRDLDTGKINRIIKHHNWKRNDIVIVIDNSYHVDPNLNVKNYKSTIIGGFFPTKYVHRSAKIIETNYNNVICDVIIKDMMDLKVECPILIEYDDGKRFFVAPNMIKSIN